MSQASFTDAQVERAIAALTEPGRFEEAEARVAGMAPALQRILGEALQSGGWFDEAHDSQIRKAASVEDDAERLTAVRTLLAEETRVGMLVGVAVGWELARELGPPEEGDGPREGESTGGAQ
jgi:hypothetical protein